MNTNFDPRSPSTSYAGSAQGTPLTPIQNPNIPSVGSAASLSSPMRHSHANPVHRVQKSAGVKQLYTADWTNGFAYQPNPNVPVPSRPGSAAPSVCSGISVNSHMSMISGMSQFSTLSVNTNMTRMTHIYAMMPHPAGAENQRPNYRPPMNLETMNQCMKKTEELLKDNEGDKAKKLVKLMCEHAQNFSLPRQEDLNQLFLCIFTEIEKVCQTIRENAARVDADVDKRLSSWLLILYTMYLNEMENVKLAVKNACKEKRNRPIFELCNLLLPNRMFSLHVVQFINVSFRTIIINAIRINDNLRYEFVNKLMNIARNDFSNTSARATAISIVRKYVFSKNELENETNRMELMRITLCQLLSKELEEPVLFHILKLVFHFLSNKRDYKNPVKYPELARTQFYNANGLELVCNLMKTHGSSRLIDECLGIISNLSRHEVSNKHILIILPAVLQLVGVNDLRMTEHISVILCRLSMNHKKQLLEMNIVGTIFHLLFQIKNFNPKQIYQLRQMQNYAIPQNNKDPGEIQKDNLEIEKINQAILRIAENCFRSLKYLGDVSENAPTPNNVFMEQLSYWRMLGNETNQNTFDAGIVLLDYLSAKKKLRKQILPMLQCMCGRPDFRNRMLNIRGGQLQLELSQVLVAIIFRIYKDYDSEADKNSCHDQLRFCCAILFLLTNSPHIQKIIQSFEVDCMNNSTREPLTLLESFQKDRDMYMLIYVQKLVEQVPDAVSVFNSLKQRKVVDDLCLNSDPDIGMLARKLNDNLCKRDDSTMYYKQSFHLMTPQDTPNYTNLSHNIVYSDESDISPNLNRNYPYS